MIHIDNVILDKICLHKVGNKVEEEGVIFSKSPLCVNENISKLLVNYFFANFKSNEYYNLFHDSDLNLNEIFVYASNIFDNKDSILQQSKNIAKHLYNKSMHPKINGGELYIAYFKDCVIDGQLTDGVGIFKSETKETYLRVFSTGDDFEINSDFGININKLDKGCLIFNLEREKGFLVGIVDNSSKGSEARYWKDEFLHVKQRNDEYYYTNNIISLCKNFVSKNKNIDNVQKADILNKAVSFFSKNDFFDIDEFSNQIIQEQSLRDEFQSYKKTFEEEREVVIADDFTISENATKKQSRSIKNIIKLDKNFKITIDGDIRYLEKGFDEHRKLNFYKLFCRDEE